MFNPQGPEAKMLTEAKNEVHREQLRKLQQKWSLNPAESREGKEPKHLP